VLGYGITIRLRFQQSHLLMWLGNALALTAQFCVGLLPISPRSGHDYERTCNSPVCVGDTAHCARKQGSNLDQGSRGAICTHALPLVWAPDLENNPVRLDERIL